jgi:chaperonin cofactor prefoldin
LGIDYSRTGVIAIKAIQEQQAIIQKLNERIEELEKKLLALEKQIMR